MNKVVNEGKEHQTHLPVVMDWREYPETPRGKNLFFNIYSLQWHIRKNRKALIECGAIIKLRGRDYLHIELFEKSIIDIGSAEARKSLNR